MEVEYHLLLARDLGYVDDERHEELSGDVVEVKKMLRGFTQYLGEGTGMEDEGSGAVGGGPSEVSRHPSSKASNAEGWAEG
jgi:hypothetical protein